MPYLVEIKARCAQPLLIREALQTHGASLQGSDHQIDHYFRVPTGRLKLRRGQLERSLIFYQRSDLAGPKDSRVALCKLGETPRVVEQDLLGVLTTALGQWQLVDKQREIYWADNVKLHLDEVAGLGSFVEIEAIGDTEAEHDRLAEQCRRWMDRLGVKEKDLLTSSYSDMLG